MTIKTKKEINSEITELEREKELIVEEKSALRKKIGDKKREISVLRKQMKKAEKGEKTRNLRRARQKLRSQEGKEKEKEKEKRSIVSLRGLLFLPVISATLLLSVLYANAIIPFETLDFLATYYPLVIPFIIFSISLACLIASIFYFVLYQVIQNYAKTRRVASVRERESLKRSQTVMLVAVLCVMLVFLSCFTIIATVEAVNRLFWWVPHESKIQANPLIIGFWCLLWFAFCVKTYFMTNK
jgi:hypothetical protein